MSLLTDTDIERAQKRQEIIIKPFDPKSLTPVGYDIRVGKWATSLKTGRILLDNTITSTSFTIQPHESVLILSEESIHVSRRIGGTFHTMVPLVARGFSSISTTLDPGWTGKLFITVTNMTDRDIHINKGDRLTTLIFYRATHQAKQTGSELTARKKLQDIIVDLAKEAGLSEDLSQALEKADATLEAEKEAEQNYKKIEDELRKAGRKRPLRIGILIVLALILASLIGLAVAERGDSNIEITILIGIAAIVVASIGIIAPILPF